MFTSQGIVATELLEAFGVEAQGLVVAPRVVHGQIGFCRIVRLDERLGGCGRFDAVAGVDVEEAAQGVERHAGGVGLAVGRVAGDVGRTDEDTVEQVEVDGGFVLPYVDDGVRHLSILQGVKQGFCLDHFAPRRVGNDGPALQVAEEVGIGQVESLVGSFADEGDVEGQHVTFFHQLLQRREEVSSFLLLAWRVVQKDTHAQFAAHLRHFCAYIAYTDDAQRLAFQSEPLLLFEEQEGGAHVLGYGGRIATRGILPCNACLLAIDCVDVVEADGGGSDEAHAAALEQVAVATGAGADDQGIGIPDKFGREVLAGHVDGLVGNACQRFSDKRNFVVDYNFHVVSSF